MAKGDKPVVPQKETKEKKQKDSLYLENLEWRRQNLELALMRKKALKTQNFKSDNKESQNKVGQAVKLSSEFLASVIVGVVLGLGFDKLTGLLPWGLIFFLFLGFTSGIMSILRSLGRIAPSQLGKDSVSHQNKRVDQINK
ncbi:AtpZ/AtpI family protein [Bartonella bovis]|uniref:ATP synthase protein I n=1 Tax=Bartonella bovis m02 TaxID=1094492 RepID=N6VHN7_9HYPH|nr:AtpZ/AtpI family protein [Bartonella bovis]ENN93325.1 ATP synthase protein I [Bartonella bovis m02]